MLSLVTQQFAAEQINTTVEAHGAWLSMWIPIVSNTVAMWLKDEWRLYDPEIDSAGDVVLDSNGDPIPTDVVNLAVQGAIVVELAYLFRNREGEGATVSSDAGYGYMLNQSSTNMLQALRKTTIA